MPHRTAMVGPTAGPVRRRVGTPGGSREQDGDQHRDLLGGRAGRQGERDGGRRHTVGGAWRRRDGAHSGMFPCFLGGRLARLVRSARNALVTFIRVFEGVMTVSM